MCKVLCDVSRKLVADFVCDNGEKRRYAIQYAPKKLPLQFNGTERVVPLPFNNISLSVHDPFLICSRSVRIFCLF